MYIKKVGQNTQKQLWGKKTKTNCTHYRGKPKNKKLKKGKQQKSKRKETNKTKNNVLGVIPGVVGWSRITQNDSFY